ncbi:MAG: VOC family protein [Phenylobacterium sp.]|uniref:VOC family protein n=1 Tax=Phenylobacterium sp. TaxID=1871053 RepID=UPI00273271BA|nr:VOC family protein [Phenylobacterium sp.]MDP1641792.1 VOC family protein [Phenylobacterium sp.]MDP3116597.1 VOC family protein [Phenylobacterium sp.]
MTAQAQVTAVAFYRDPEAALAWLSEAFGFETTILLTDAEGRLAHAEMELHGVKLGVAGEWEGGVLGPARMRSPASLEGQGTQFCRIELPPQVDIDQHCARAGQAGARITQTPQDEFYGDRTYRCLDLEGHVWNFSQPRRTVSPAEVTAATGLIYAVGGEDPAKPAEAARSAVTPYVSYRDPQAAYAWLETAFGLEPRIYVTDDAGELVHAEMTFRGQTVGVSRAWSDRHATPADVQGRNTQTVHLQLAFDIDAHHARAVAAGAEIIRPLETQAYGDRTYLALDLEGHVWSFGQTVAPMSPAQWDAELGTSTSQRPSTR